MLTLRHAETKASKATFQADCRADVSTAAAPARRDWHLPVNNTRRAVIGRRRARAANGAASLINTSRLGLTEAAVK